MTLRTSSSRPPSDRAVQWSKPEREPGLSTAGDPATPRPSAWRAIALNLRSIALAVLIALVIRIGVVEVFEIEGPSMEPTLLNGERVVVTKYPFGLFLPLREQADLNWGSPRAGDVVVLKSPADGVAIIKRVIGVAGDTVEVHNDIVYRNGQALPRRDLGRCLSGSGSALPGCHWYESEIDGRRFVTSGAGRSFEGSRTLVSDKHIYVLGDHRDMSNDSRNPAIGLVPVTRIKGRSVAIHWSRGDDGLRFDRMFHAVH